jgi:chaperone modulatory protein CbpM
MSNESLTPCLQGIILEEQTQLTLAELCSACAVHAEWVMDLVAEGILDPVGREPRYWQFTGTHLHRAGVALRLQRDLGVNLAGIALALQLLDRIETLQMQLRMNDHCETHLQ